MPGHHDRHGSPGAGLAAAFAADVLVAAAALAAVVLASVVMEQAATRLGAHFRVPQIATGGVVLAAVTTTAA